MKDAKDKKKEIHDKHREDRQLKRDAGSDRSDLARSRGQTSDTPHSSDYRMSALDRLHRIERIESNDSAKHLKDYNLRRAERLEDFEIRTNAKGFERRSRGHGLDRATERLVELEKTRQERKYRRDH